MLTLIAVPFPAKTLCGYKADYVQSTISCATMSLDLPIVFFECSNPFTNEYFPFIRRVKANDLTRREFWSRKARHCKHGLIRGRQFDVMKVVT
ncbi:hypothetical protein D4768_17275 [Rhodococcus erythropolis]|nr:hypothetical protein D4768_17275 [Rhodococcus erythropolis]